MKKEERKKNKKVEKIWMNNEILHLISLQGKMKCEFVKNTKKMKNSNFTSNFSCACFNIYIFKSKS
jgi:hypothetical protein